MSLPDMVLTNLANRGYKACIVAIDKMKLLEEEYRVITEKDAWRRSPHLSQHEFTFAPPSEFESAKSVIVVAVPVTPVKLGFVIHNKRTYFEVPPLSVEFEHDLKIIKNTIHDIIMPLGYGLTDANIPTKLLASHAGLLSNGYNNMGYIEGMGSFFRLTAYFSSLPPGDTAWDVHRVSLGCEECRDCVTSCPTGCLGTKGYDVSRCLSLLSKETSDFPVWALGRLHSSLIGCHICQQVCPMNKRILESITIGAEFSETETEAILNGLTFDKLAPITQNKLKRFHLEDYYDVIPRNLRLLLSKGLVGD